MAALPAAGRFADRGPVRRPAEIDAAVHRVRALQRHLRSFLGSVPAHPVQQEHVHQTAPLSRPLRQGGDTRRRREARNRAISVLISETSLGLSLSWLTSEAGCDCHLASPSSTICGNAQSTAPSYRSIDWSMGHCDWTDNSGRRFRHQILDSRPTLVCARSAISGPNSQPVFLLIVCRRVPSVRRAASAPKSFPSTSSRRSSSSVSHH